MFKPKTEKNISRGVLIFVDFLVHSKLKH